ncbi:MAG: class I SAM-dependent DNA methyltransferase, partial [Bacteroidetes bacterium]|nr:class I SAM-dependent DNA methyltransferase [Bacteroidota bacterium]
EKNLEAHFPQVRDYWIEMNPETVIGPGAQKPKYVILCNFDRFLIYRQLSLVDEIAIDDFVDRASAFNFMLPGNKEPIFHNNVEAISQDAARTIGKIFKHLIFEKKEDRAVAQRFLLQCVLALFSEDFGLLPQFIFSELIRDCQKGQSTYDLFGGLFNQMANPNPAKGGRFKDVKYFNGGLFDMVEPLELDSTSLNLLADAATFNWKSVNPAIFGALFESTMNEQERHQFGAHFTSEADILKIVNPTIVRPWKERLNKANTLQELSNLLDELENFKVLDPACGCGNFLYVAYRALKDIEMQIVEKIAANFSARSARSVKFGISRVSTKQFYGIDLLPVAVEVARVTMMLGKELAADEWNKRI